MKFVVDREPFAEAVTWVARALPARPVIPVLSGILLRADDEGVTLSCFDYEVSARMRIAATVGEPGTVLLPGRLLAEIVRGLPDRPAEFSSAGDVVTLRCGTVEYGLATLPADDFPKLPDSPPVAGHIDAAALATAVAQVAPSASRDDGVPMLTAVCLDIDAAVLTIAATDRYRMAVRAAAWTSSAGLRATALVPARILAQTARMMAAGGPVELGLSATQSAPESQAAGSAAESGVSTGPDPASGPPAQTTGGFEPRPVGGMISFESGGRRLTVRLLAGEYVRYESRFPAGYGCCAELPAGPFFAAVRRVCVVAEAGNPVRLEFEPDTVLIEAEAGEGRARAVESVHARFEGDQREISFNPRYLLDGLAAAALCSSAPDGPGEAAVTAPDAVAGRGEAAGRDAVPGRDAVAGRDDLPDAAGGPMAGGRVRLQFTSHSRPALITWAEAEPESGGEQAFRYLVVPQRVLARA